MNKILEKAKIEPDELMIGAATDQKNFSGKRIEDFLFGIMLIGIGLYGLYASFDLLLGTPGQWDGIIPVILGISTNKAGWFGNLVILVLCLFFLLISCLLMVGGIALMRAISSWFFILYPDRILYKYRDSGKYKDFTLPITEVNKCFIVRKRTNTLSFLKFKRFVSIVYHVNIHLEYTKDNELHYVSLTQPDGFIELNKIITYLQDDKGIPVYFTTAEPEKYEEIKDLEALQITEPEQVYFTGDLALYDKKNRNVHSLD